MEGNLVYVLKAFQLCHPRIPLLRIYPEEINMFGHNDFAMRIFISALIIIVEGWKLPTCSDIEG
jgi:hypothetical protein